MREKVQKMKMGNSPKETFYSENGLSEFVEFLDGNRERLIQKVVSVEGEKVVYLLRLLVYNNSYAENIHSYVNNINTHEGVPIYQVLEEVLQIH